MFRSWKACASFALLKIPSLFPNKEMIPGLFLFMRILFSLADPFSIYAYMVTTCDRSGRNSRNFDCLDCME